MSLRVPILSLASGVAEGAGNIYTSLRRPVDNYRKGIAKEEEARAEARRLATLRQGKQDSLEASAQGRSDNLFLVDTLAPKAFEITQKGFDNDAQRTQSTETNRGRITQNVLGTAADATIRVGQSASQNKQAENTVVTDNDLRRAGGTTRQLLGDALLSEKENNQLIFGNNPNNSALQQMIAYQNEKDRGDQLLSSRALDLIEKQAPTGMERALSTAFPIVYNLAQLGLGASMRA